jgi:hypothetical protein
MIAQIAKKNEFLPKGETGYSNSSGYLATVRNKKMIDGR